MERRKHSAKRIGQRVKGKEQRVKGRAHGAKSSVLWPFILGCCDMGGNYSVNVKELYDHYRETVTIGIHGQKIDHHALSFKVFEDELKKALPFVGKEKRRPERRMYFTGIRLKAQSAESIAHSTDGKIHGKAVEGGGDWGDEEGLDVIDGKSWASSSIKHVPSEVVKELADDIKSNRDNEIVKHIVPDFTSNDMLKKPMEKGQAGVKSPIEIQIDELETQINALNDGMRVLGIRVVSVSAYDDEISNTYPADFKENDKTPENNRSRVFNRLDLLLSKVAWIATVQKRIEELLEI